MAYVAVKGGDDAVEKSIALLERYRTRGDGDVRLEALEKRMSLLIDRVMSEAGFYAPRYAALALKQSEGALEEAVFLLRAYRSALSRDYRSLPMDGADMVIHRRISAAFKDVEGGQFLGATYDYTHRLLNFDLLEEKSARLLPIRRPGVYRPAMNTADKRETSHKPADGTVITAPRVSQELREEGLLTGPETPRRRIPGQAAEPMAAGTGRETDIKTQAEYPGETETPADITRHPIHFPASRSAQLHTLARADTGFLSGLAYAGIRGFGPSHPTVGELRTGVLDVLITHPLLEGERWYAGGITVTEVESLFPEETAGINGQEGEDPLQAMNAGQGDKADLSEKKLGLGMGYGMVLGRNDNKAIAMSVMDYILNAEGDGILHNQEFVLLHGDCLEMNGFLSHLKLPHYVTFQSKLDRVRHTRKKDQDQGRSQDHGHTKDRAREGEQI